MIYYDGVYEIMTMEENSIQNNNTNEKINAINNKKANSLILN